FHGIHLTHGFPGLPFGLLIDLVQQTADTAPGKVPERRGEPDQFLEVFPRKHEAERILRRHVYGAGGPLAYQRGQREAFAHAGLDGGFRRRLPSKQTLAAYAPLFYDTEVLSRTGGRANATVAS